MYKKACPVCGSLFFLTSKTGPKTVFHVNADATFEIITEENGQEINPGAICCGACSWQGDSGKLVESR